MTGGAEDFDHFEAALAHPGLGDLVIGADQLERLALDQRVLLLLEGRCRLAEALAVASRQRPASQHIGRHPVEEIQHRHVERLGELEQPARADAVGAAFVFWICWKVSPTALPTAVWFMASRVRRWRMRRP